MIKLIDLIRLAGVELEDFKIHCATGSAPTPLEAFFDGSFKLWQEHQNQKNFQCQHVLSLIHLGGDQWLFAGVYAVEGVAPGTWKDSECYQYATRELDGLEHLTGRAIVKFNRKFRASYLRGSRFVGRLVVVAIRDQRMTIGDFPGYNSVLLSYPVLKTVVREGNPSWRTALANVAGVYVIADRFDGRLYVGSAYGGQGIWQRWTAYAKTGHGGNKELRELLRRNGEGRAEHFQFSLLEVFDLSSSDDYVLSRESHWKDVLLSREFGLNRG
jgi:hypothetical protein